MTLSRSLVINNTRTFETIELLIFHSVGILSFYYQIDILYIPYIGHRIL